MNNEIGELFNFPKTPEELSAFYKAALFRLLIGILAIACLIILPFTKGLISVGVLAVALLIGETVLSTMRLHAKFRAIRREKMEAEAARQQAAAEVAAALAQAKAEAAASYFDLDDADAADQPGISPINKPATIPEGLTAKPESASGL